MAKQISEGIDREMDKNKVMRKYVIDEMSKFKDFSHIENFTKTLDPDRINKLCEWLSSWRNNSVFNEIANGPDNWLEDTISINKIRVGKVNEIVNTLLMKHDYFLSKISNDRDICEHDEFVSQGSIASKCLIAKKLGENFEIIDGIHRAIRLACDGVKDFNILYYEVQ